MNSITPGCFVNHFFGLTNPPIPKEVFSLITNHLNQGQRPVPASCLVNKEWHEFYIDDTFWCNAGANNYQDFIDRVRVLDDKLKNLVYNQICSLPFAEETQEIFKLNLEGRSAKLFPDGLGVAIDHDKLNALLSDNGVLVLKEGLITLDQATALELWRLQLLLNDSGLQLLKGGLITPDQAAIMETSTLKSLLSNGGLQALREGLITPDQATALELWRLQLLISDSGLQALREGLITPDQAAAMGNYALEELLKDRV